MSRRIVGWVVVPLVAMALLAGCASEPDPTEDDRAGYKVGTPYQIGGMWYTPVEDYAYDQVGIASWYGDEFNGRRTANGEVFDKNKVSAAHKTLPMPSVVEVTNLENGRSLVARVNDRGPFVHGRIIDLSERGAELLGFASKGTARVRVRVLAAESMEIKMQTLTAGGRVPGVASAVASPSVAVDSQDLAAPVQSAGETQEAANGTADIASDESMPPAPEAAPSRPTPADSSAGPVFVQAGSFREQDNATRMSDELSGFGPTRVVATDIDGQRYFRVQLGPFDTVDKGNDMVLALRDVGIAGARMVNQ